MSRSTTDRLYKLLPAIYRVRDAARGEPLRALLAVMESEFTALEDDIEGMYRDWFIETCAEWVVPYIGDLLAVRGVHAVDATDALSLRAYVANTLAYRRRKGTPAVLEQLSRDITGWPARVVEFFQRLGTTQYMNHIRLENLRTPDLRKTAELELVGTPFDTANYSGEVRRIARGRGRYNIPNIGLFLWRLESYSLSRAAPAAANDPSDGRYTFHPLGLDIPLFNRPRTEREITDLAQESDVPGALRRRALYDELEALRQALAENRDPPTSLYFSVQPVLQLSAVFVVSPPESPPEQEITILPQEILVCDLSDWRRPPETKSYITAVDYTVSPPIEEKVDLPIRVAVDPELGRLAFPEGIVATQVFVSYAYGFSGDVGGGPYDRRESVSEVMTREVTWHAGVSAELADDGVEPPLYATLGDAVKAWNVDSSDGDVGVITIMDNLTYEENLLGAKQIEIPPGSQLLIVAADWPQVGDVEAGEELTRIDGQVVPTDRRPLLVGDLSVQGTAATDENPGELIIDGLLVNGRVTVEGGNLGRLRLAHCAVIPTVPGEVAITVVVPSPADLSELNDQLTVELERTICGRVSLPDSVPELIVEESILDPSPLTNGVSEQDREPAIEAPGTAVEIRASTIAGTSELRTLKASDCVFTELVMVERRQEGCVRFSSVPTDSRTPRRYRCQPDLALVDVTDPDEQFNIKTRLTPQFVSTDYGNPSYFQLRRTTAEEIRTGASDSSEMGVFSHLKQPQREASLRSALDEYLRFGLEAGMFFVT